MGKLSWLDDAVKGAARNLDDAAQAAANQLDMSKAARMQRAAEQGADTTTKWLHGGVGRETDFGQRSNRGYLGAVYLNDKPEVADSYAMLGGIDSNIKTSDAILDEATFHHPEVYGDRNPAVYPMYPITKNRLDVETNLDIVDTLGEQRIKELLDPEGTGEFDNFTPQELKKHIRNNFTWDKVGELLYEDADALHDASPEFLFGHISGGIDEYADAKGIDSYLLPNDGESGGRTLILRKPEQARSIHAAFDPANIGKNDLLGAATIGGMATAGAVGAGAMAAKQYDFGTPDYDAKIQEFRNRRAAKGQIWKELKEAGATIASAIPAGIISDAYRIGGYLSPVTPVEETERGAEIVQNALMYTPEGDNRYLNEFARQVNQFGQDVEPLVNAWKQTPIYRGYKQLPQRIQGLIKTASDYAF